MSRKKPWTIAVTLQIPIELLLKPYKVEDA